MPDITTYEQASDYLKRGRNKTDRPLPGKGTRLQRRGSAIAVRYWNTDVVTFYRDGRISLATGGHLTRTTERRIETYSPCRVVASYKESGWTGKLLEHGPYDWIIRLPNGETEEISDGFSFQVAS